MKAKIKATGEIVDVTSYRFNTVEREVISINYILDGCFTVSYSGRFDLLDDIQKDHNLIDWEQRQWDATVAAMQGLLAYGYNAEDAVNYAKELIKQYKEK